MQRVEIIANRSVEEDLEDEFRRRGLSPSYTKLPEVHGAGTSGPRMGDHVWPEENFVLVIYCDDEETPGLKEAVSAVKQLFPDEGIRMFASEAIRLA
ncbi:MAG: PG0541 family transporter-associated protein [Spirochaetaceae bacterium]